MDVLGFIGMAKEAEREGRSQELLRHLYRALDKARTWLEDKNIELLEPTEQDFYAVKAFTDNIVIGWPVRSSAEGILSFALRKASDFQLDMALAGFFVRGAITIGDAYINEIAVFGPAIIEAYEGEKQRAHNPRIVLAGTSVDAAKQDLNHQYVDRDPDDDQFFVNYLQSALLYKDEHKLLSEKILRHKTVVETKLRQFREQPKIWKKYAWVAEYHNSFCEKHSKYFDDSYKISSHELQL